MRMFPKEFPSSRRKMPKRRAERRVYEALANSNRRGFVYYEWRRGYEHIELDFAVWVEGLGRFVLQVKGGHYQIIDGEWYLKTRRGWKAIGTSPLDAAWLGALDLHDDIEERAETAYNPFVIPVLVFPDMEPDEAIKSLARRKGVYVIWGTGHLMTDLEQIVGSRRVSDTLPAERIAGEVLAVTDGLIRLSQAGDAVADDGAEGEVSISGRGRPGVLRLAVGGTTVLTIRSRAVRCRLGERIRIGREPKR